MKDTLPAAGKLRQELLAEPAQLPIQKLPLETTVNGVKYSIQPKFSYELYGLVVSLHDSDAWWDLAHREWGDHINLVDLCVVWGENVRRDSYRAISFSNTQWECHWGTHSEEAWKRFDQTAAANNHMVTDSPSVARALRNVRVGDEVRFRGYLVDYTTFKNGAAAGTRVSSTVRTDAGPGACEVVYVEDMDILSSANRWWRLIFKGSMVALLLSLVAWALAPVKFKD
jgi:hypothetical protein